VNTTAKRILIAEGGNSFIKDSNRTSVHDQYLSAWETSRYIADIVQEGHKIIITHGNGPQVGFILRRSELSRQELHEVPLVSCVADTQGALGYHIQQTLMNELKLRNIDRCVVTVVTQIVVDRNDPSFKNPSKPIGQFYEEHEAGEIVRERGWNMLPDANRGWRRVVPSPKPMDIIEFCAIKRLFENNIIVIAAGGGGIPVVREADNILAGIDAVIDKDLASALLGSMLKIQVMIISTAVSHVALDFGKPSQRNIEKMTVKEAKKYIQEGHFKSGSMLPKIEAAIQFIEGGGEEVIITNPQSIFKAFHGNTGTHIINN
jgi:carbamate kinase